jgi:putative YhbY family RNA-binding protein
MPILPLSSAQRSALRAQAHDLAPVVMIGDAGLTEGVMKEAEHALSAHQLIKIRVFADEKEVRADYMSQLCEQLGASPVQMIGKLLVIYRPESAAPKKKTFAQSMQQDQDGFKGQAPRRVTVMKAPANPAHRPRAKQMTIKGNERVTSGGIVKRAKKTTVSSKKKMG